MLDGFSAALDPRAVSLLEQMPEVAGIYPVRATFPASFSAAQLATEAYGVGRAATGPTSACPASTATASRSRCSIPASTQRIRTSTAACSRASTSSTAAAMRRRGRTRKIARNSSATGRSSPASSSAPNGPGGLHGVAPAASVLPIRVAGWQAASDGRELVYGRSDQLIAGLDRAVDPNGDGDEHDAVRVALVGVTEPYAAFTDGPEAQAVQGALDLNTLVVTPAGNDGGAGPAFGSVAGPAGAPAALAVAATDARTAQPQVRVVLRRGLDVIFDERVPLLGAAAPAHAANLHVVAPRATAGVPGAAPIDFFDQHGLSLVAGKAVVLPAGDDPEATVVSASRAGAAAVLLYGASLPAGSLRLSEDATAPAVVVPSAQAVELLAAQRAGLDVGISVGAVHDATNTGRGLVASSRRRASPTTGR